MAIAELIDRCRLVCTGLGQSDAVSGAVLVQGCYLIDASLNGVDHVVSSNLGGGKQHVFAGHCRVCNVAGAVLVDVGLQAATGLRVG